MCNKVCKFQLHFNIVHYEYITCYQHTYVLFSHRYVGLGSHHPGGTCVMGTAANNSVVDSQFKWVSDIATYIIKLRLEYTF